MSGRHVSTVYKISSRDGSLLWRLGGQKSDFKLDEGADFHWQHDARIRYENATHTIISILDNASSPYLGQAGGQQTRAVSSGKIIALNTETMTATLVRHFPRPQGLPSRKMGNLQTLGENPIQSNILVNWASPGGISEFDSKNKLVLGASLWAGTVTSYRVPKQQFVGLPLHPPIVTILPAVRGPSGDEVSAIFYMRWNGAKEIRSWKIWVSTEI